MLAEGLEHDAAIVVARPFGVGAEGSAMRYGRFAVRHRKPGFFVSAGCDGY